MSKIYDRLTCCDLYDSDTDGLPDVFETAGMKLPTGEIIFTETDKPDSDDDGLLDGEEIDYTINDGYVKFKLVSNPTLADSDGDGYDDYYETYTSKTDPLKSNVFEFKLSKSQYVSINDGKYYGGNQNWFSMKNTDISKSGCGLISATDFLIYLSLTRENCERIVQIDDIHNINIDSYFDFCEKIHSYITPWHLPDFIADLICVVMGSRYTAIGLTPSQVCNGIEKYLSDNNIKSKIKYSYDVTDTTLSNIVKSIKNDIPVLMFISDEPIDLRKEKNGTNEGYVKWHWVNITEVYVDSVANEIVLSFSSWGEKYYCDFLDINNSVTFYYIDIIMQG